MAIYRIFPSKDASIYSDKLNRNTGRDSILEIGEVGRDSLVRSLIEFDTAEINSAVALSNGGYTANLNLYCATADNLNISTAIEAVPLLEGWVEGKGHLHDTPENTAGVSWNYVDGVLPWSTDLGGTYTTSYSSSNVLNYREDLDLSIDLTNFITAVQSGSITNNGVLLKYANESIDSDSSNYLQFFSRETNTIYYPYLEFVWDDSNQTSTLEVLDDPEIVISYSNIRSEYPDTGKTRIRLNGRPEHPTRVFATSSLYSQKNILPEESYWAIEDVVTGDYIIDFNTIGTKLSSDDRGNYFDFHLDNLFSERYYRVVIKTNISGIDIVTPCTTTFKVLRNG